MEISPEILAGVIAIGFGLVRVIETLISKGYSLITGNKNGYNEKAYKEIKLIGENHLGDILDAIKEQTKCSREDHQKQIELLIKISTILETKR